MAVKSIFVNLPVKDLQKTRDFWEKLGFSFDEKFTDDKALCLVLKKEAIYAMLLKHEFFKTFTNRPIFDGKSTQVLNAIEVESKEMVNEIVKLALENAAVRYREPEDHGWMYSDSFADLDGHQWEVFYADISKLNQAV